MKQSIGGVELDKGYHRVRAFGESAPDRARDRPEARAGDMGDARKVVIIAGPNGAGKTTFTQEFLPNEANCPVFVNADPVAAGIAPFRPETPRLLEEGENP